MKKFLILFTSVFCSFFLIDKVNAENFQFIDLQIPNTDIEASFGIDTDIYPYYYGIMRADTSNGIFKVDFYYSAEQLYYGSMQNTTCGLNSGYEENPCYGYLTKSTSTVPVYHYYKYYHLDNGHLSSANNEPETVSRSSMFGYFILATYNFSDYVEYATSWGGYNSYGFPLIKDYSIPWVASSDIYDKNDHNILILSSQYVNELIHNEPEATYVISDGSEIGKKITFNFQNFDNDSYADITNLSTGDIIHLTDLKTNNSYVIDNISFDSVYYVEVYNSDSLVFVDTIDINEEVRLAKKPYINLTLDKERLIAWLEFMNLKPDYHVYYSKNNGEFTEVSLEENKNSIIVGFNNEQPELHNKNYTIHGKITDSNNNILYERGYNIVFFPDSPYFTFKSSYNSDSGCNQLTITFHNSLNSDIVSYSFDNTNFQNFSNIKTNVLELCSNSHIYVKATRGNDIYYGYYYVNISEFSSSSNESFQQELSLLTTFNNLFTGIDLSFLNNINSFFNALKSSYVFRFLMLCITGALILFIMRLIRR